jgi:hydroxymethylglutaryl-CoA lyase
MGFGNLYGDEYNPEIVMHWINELKKLRIKIISLADTVGVAKPDIIAYLFSQLIPAHTDLEIGAHFHTTATTWREKIESAFANGCTRFDGAINGIGGCPMAQEDLVGNMDTLNLLSYFKEMKYNETAFLESVNMANKIFI